MDPNTDQDYRIFKDIVGDLLSPINDDLDAVTKKHLYKSKLVYLHHLRERVFRLINRDNLTAPFQREDLDTIISAIQKNNSFLKELYIGHLHASIKTYAQLEAKSQKG